MKFRWRGGLVLAATVLLSACNGGPRPTLVEPPGPTPEPDVQLDLTPAPPEVAPLPPAPADLALESSVDDALLAWAIDRNVPYTDACARVTPQPGQLCDSPTGRDNVRLLGPTPEEPWYIVIVREITSFDAGTGFRVDEVQIAGR